MYRILLCCLLFIAGCSVQPESPVKTPSPIPTPTVITPVDVVSALNIDNKIVYYDVVGNMACFPYLLDDNNAYYCSADDTIYYGNAITTNNPIIVKYFALAHEDGHSEDENWWSETVFQAEQFADCYGGMQMARLYNEGYIDILQLQQLSDFIHTFPHNDHGSPVQRYHAFAQGYLHNDCSFGILNHAYI